MKLLILGATGALGAILVEELLKHDFNLVVYVRSPLKLPKHTLDRVTIIKGELTEEDKLAEAMEGVHAVVSTLGPAVTSGPFYPSGTPLARAYERILDLMHRQNITRIIALGTTAFKDEHDKFDVKYWGMINGVATFARNAYNEFAAIGQLMSASHNLVWTLVRVPILTNARTTSYHAGYVGDGTTRAWLARPAFAAFVLDELQNNTWARKSPVLSVVPQTF